MADSSAIVVIGLGLFVLVLVGTVYLATRRYKLAPSNQILVVYGNTKGAGAAQCYHGGGKIVWPLIQNYGFLDLKPMTININLEHALSMQNIRINVPSTFTIGIDTKPSIMQNAAERLLGLPPAQIEDMAKEIIFGQLRLTVASLTIEEINGDREAFLSQVVNNVDTELHKIGLYLINVNITDITDEADYIKSSVPKRLPKPSPRPTSTEPTPPAKVPWDRHKPTVPEKSKWLATKPSRTKVRKRPKPTDVSTFNSKNPKRRGENFPVLKSQLQRRPRRKEAEALKRSEVAKRKAQVEIEKAQSELKVSACVQRKSLVRKLEAAD